jgi:hypothetical protein
MKLIMERSSKNENTCDVFMNEVRIKDEFFPKHEEISNRKK